MVCPFSKMLLSRREGQEPGFIHLGKEWPPQAFNELNGIIKILPSLNSISFFYSALAWRFTQSDFLSSSKAGRERLGWGRSGERSSPLGRLPQRLALRLPPHNRALSLSAPQGEDPLLLPGKHTQIPTTFQQTASLKTSTARRGKDMFPQSPLSCAS